MHPSTKIAASITGVLCFLGIVSTLIGIPGTMDDLATWQQWINYAREVIPWQLSMAVAVGSFLGAIALWIPWSRILTLTKVMTSHKVNAGPVKFHFHVSQPTVTHMKASRYVRLKNRMKKLLKKLLKL